MKAKTLIVKVTIPRIISDNPLCVFSTRDGKWIQEIPINTRIVKWMRGKHEAYFRLTMNAMKIVSMKEVSEDIYYASAESDKKTTNSK